MIWCVSCFGIFFIALLTSILWFHEDKIELVFDKIINYVCNYGMGFHAFYHLIIIHVWGIQEWACAWRGLGYYGRSASSPISFLFLRRLLQVDRNSRASFVSPQLTPGGTHCFSFWYHMHAGKYAQSGLISYLIINYILTDKRNATDFLCQRF